MAEFSPQTVERLAELLDSTDERVRLVRPAIQADISLRHAETDGHFVALLEIARRRALEPITLEDDEVDVVAMVPSVK